MSKTLHAFTDTEMAILKEIVADVRRLRGNVPGRPGSSQLWDWPSWTTPEVYIAKPRKDGDADPPLDGTIKALERAEGDPCSDKPGKALCDIYTLQEAEEGDQKLCPVQKLTKRVYNISGSAVPDDWFIALRDKFGRWLAVTASPAHIFGRIKSGRVGYSYPFVEVELKDATPSGGVDWDDKDDGIEGVCYEQNANHPNWDVPGTLIVELKKVPITKSPLDEGEEGFRWIIDRGLPNPGEGPRHQINPPSQC